MSIWVKVMLQTLSPLQIGVLLCMQAGLYRVNGETGQLIPYNMNYVMFRALKSRGLITYRAADKTPYKLSRAGELIVQPIVQARNQLLGRV